jgi:3-oxoacyl-[acyl-carrier protein] reductase
MTDIPVALVTGASRGIGAATAEEFARRGYRVAILARTVDDLNAVADRIRQAGGEALVFAGDLADLDYAESALRATVDQWNRLDVLVNNAAWRELVTMRNISLESWERTLRVCLTAPAFLARWAAEVMEPQGAGVIINVSSIMSKRAGGIGPAYIASKGALDSLTYELANLYGRSGIRVVAINPGAIDTAGSADYTDAEGESITTQLRQWSEDHIPVGHWATAEDVACAIAMLAGDDARYLTGMTVIVDGGWTHNLFSHTLRKKMYPGEF